MLQKLKKTLVKEKQKLKIEKKKCAKSRITWTRTQRCYQGKFIIIVKYQNNSLIIIYQ